MLARWSCSTTRPHNSPEWASTYSPVFCFRYRFSFYFLFSVFFLRSLFSFLFLFFIFYFLFLLYKNIKKVQIWKIFILKQCLDLKNVQIFVQTRFLFKHVFRSNEVSVQMTFLFKRYLCSNEIFVQTIFPLKRDFRSNEIFRSN